MLSDFPPNWCLRSLEVIRNCIPIIVGNRRISKCERREGIYKKDNRMSWLGKLGLTILNSNSNHFITCLLIFILHYSPQLPPSLFNLEKKSIDPLFAISNFNSNRNYYPSFSCPLLIDHGLWK